MIRYWLSLLLLIILFPLSVAGKVLIPMDLNQTNHLKAYGIAWWVLRHDITVEWLLNYRGGSFLIDEFPALARECRLRNVSFQQAGSSEVLAIYDQIEQENMDRIRLEMAPKIAVYMPPGTQPWDDAVSMALNYAEIEYTTVWDHEVLAGELAEYDWLHLHHEDFTGQYGKFYASYRSAPWYIQQQQEFEQVAHQLGYSKVSREKLAVALEIRNYVADGGFLFAMCSATDSYDIALAAAGTDICDAVFDGDPSAPDCQQKLDYSQTLAFTGFQLYTSPLIYEYSNIDTTPPRGGPPRAMESDYFKLFEFSAKWDPVPTMLTQNHVSVIKGFMGQTTGYHRENLKSNLIIMGETPGRDEVKYLHGNFGKGMFSFYGGHDPEDYQHRVGDPPTDLNLHPRSPGFRLILNNVLFPAARKQKQKT
jgi:hypothetical protein